MILADSIKKSFNCIIENPSITLFLVLFLIGANILASYILSSQVKILAQILMLCLLAFIFVFFSGWLQVIKESNDREKIKEKNFYSIFLEGIGANIIPVSIGIIIYTLFVFLALIVAQYIALHFIGDINFFLDDLNKISAQNGNFMEYFNKLDLNQKYIVYGWNIAIIVSVAIFNFLSLFYFPAIYYSEKKIFIRPFMSIWESLKFLFKNFLGALCLSVFIYILNMILAFLNAGFAQNVVLSILFLLLYIYFISYIVMLIFNYYEAKNSSSDGSDCIGENKIIDSAGEEN